LKGLATEPTKPAGNPKQSDPGNRRES